MRSNIIRHKTIHASPSLRLTKPLRAPTKFVPAKLASNSIVEPVVESVSESKIESVNESTIEVIDNSINESTDETIDKLTIESVNETNDNKSVAESTDESAIEVIDHSESNNEPVIEETINESINDFVSNDEPIIEEPINEYVNDSNINKSVDEPIDDSVNETVDYSESNDEPVSEKTISESVVANDYSESNNESVSNDEIVIKDPTNESISEIVNEAVSDSINELVSDVVNEAIDESINETVNDVVSKSVDVLIVELVSEIINESVNESVNEVVNEIISESIDETTVELINKSNSEVDESVNELVVELANESSNSEVDKSANNSEIASEPEPELVNESVNEIVVELVNEAINESVIESELVSELSNDFTSDKSADSTLHDELVEPDFSTRSITDNLTNSDSVSNKSITSHESVKYTVIMAGGSGTRMKSLIPKQLHLVGTKPMIAHLLENVYELNTHIILVLSMVNKNIVLGMLLDKHVITESNGSYFYKDKQINLCVQSVANGTGGALSSTSEFFSSKNDNDTVLVLSADVPLVTKSTMIKLYEKIEPIDTHCVILCKNTTDNFGYGRIITDSDEFIKIVEQKDCTDEEQAVTLINTGTYAFKVGSLIESLKSIDNNNSQNEYYLTDCPKIIKENNGKISLYLTEDKQFDETLGANTLEQLQTLRDEYLKKFSIEKIDDSNMTDYDIKNLMRILEQLSTGLNSNTEINTVQIKKLLASKSELNKKQLFVVRYEDRVVGTGSVLIEDKLLHNVSKVAHIEDIVIDSEYRGLGLARLLLNELVEYSKQQKVYKIILDASDNVKEFYEKLGFKRHSNSMRMDVKY